MKVVVVLPEPPYLEGGAAGRCSVGVLKGLQADERVELSAIAARAPGAAKGGPPRGLPVEIVPVPRQERLQSWLDLVHRPLGYLSRGEFGERVRQLAANTDVLYLDQTQTAWCNRGIDVPAVVHLHYLALLDQPRVPRHPRILASRFGVAAAQRYAWQRHNFLLANSDTVATELRRWAPRADVTVVPLVLDPDHYPPSIDDGEPVAGFIGSARWPATAGAARRLVEQVWPLIRREVPEAKLVVAGRGMENLGLRGDDSVEVRGEVPSGAAFMRDISVLLFPPVGGSGMKVKVLEALASGVPAVTDDVGAEGIAANDGVVHAEGDEEFARAAISILRDLAERRQRAAAALQAFRERHTPEVAAELLFELFSRMASSG